MKINSKPSPLIHVAVLVILGISTIRPMTTHAADLGQLIKLKGSPAVYLVDSDKRRPFPMLSVYQSWFGSSFSGVAQFDTVEQLSAYPLGKNVLFKPGSLIKIQTDPKVYLVTDESGHLEWIKTEEDFKARGFLFASIHDVPDTFFPDYSLTPEVSNFATPTSTAPIQPAPPVATTQPKLSITDVSLLAMSVSGMPSELITINLSTPASGSLTYRAIDGSGGSLTFITGLAFKKTFTVQPGLTYTYHAEFKTDDGAQTITRDGTFISYVDIQATAVSDLVPAGSPLATVNVVVGGFSVVNKSTTTQSLSQIILQFDSQNNSTNAPSKTLQIYRLNADKTLGALIGEKTIPSQTTIIGGLAQQKLALADEITTGSTNQYAIVIRNLESINLDLATPGDSFTTKLVLLTFLSDSTSTRLPQTSLASLAYIRK